MEKKEEQNYIRQLLLELEDYLFSLSWYDGEDRLKTFRDVSNIKSIFQLVPQRYLKLLEGRIYTQEELDKAREEGYKKGYIDGQIEKINKPKTVVSEFDKTSYLN